MPHPLYRNRPRPTKSGKLKLNIKPMKIIKKLIAGDFLNGKKTYLAVLISGIGWVAGRYGVQAEVNQVIELLKLSGPDFMTLGGLLAAIWARAVSKGNPQDK